MFSILSLFGYFLVTFAFSAIGLFSYAYLFRSDIVGPQKLSVAGLRNVLVVTAHPDDECMFFGPAIVSLASELEVEVYVLCLSIGNFENLGSVRREELTKSCVELGVPAERVKVIDDKDLADNPVQHWPSEKVADVVQDHVKEKGIDTVLTFDDRGISGHINHISVHGGVRTFLRRQAHPDATKGQTESKVVAYTLTTVRRARKYIGIFDLAMSSSALDIVHPPRGQTNVPLSRTFSTKPSKSTSPPSSPVTPNSIDYLLPDTLLFISGATGYAKAIRAMKLHKSQWVWFRRLYVMFSRYMLLNEFERMVV